MDVAWAMNRLQDFQSAIDAYIEGQHGGNSTPLKLQVLRHEYAAKRILRAVDPTMADFTWGVTSPYRIRDNVARALGMMSDREEVEEHLGPEGPTISVS